jgi:hypothetical protein
MTGEFMVKWLREAWYKKPGALEKRRMLVLGASKGYLTQRKWKLLTPNLNTVLVIISGGMTCHLQVLNVVVTKRSETDYTACMDNGCYIGTAL